MHTKLLLLIFAGSILYVHGYEYSDYSGNDRIQQKPKLRLTNQVWNQEDLVVSASSNYAEKGRSAGVLVGERTFIIPVLPTTGLINRHVSQLLPSYNRQPTPGDRNNGGTQIENSANQNSQQSNVYYDSATNVETAQGNPGGRPSLTPQYNTDTGSYSNPSQSSSLGNKFGSSIEGSSQQEYKPARAPAPQSNGANYPDVATKPSLLYPGASPLALSTMESGINMMKILGRQIAGNTVISPISIWLTLAALQQGAGSHSQQELALFLKSDSNTSSRRASELISKSKNLATGNIINIVNGIFVDQTFELNSKFKSISEQNFNAAVDILNFHQPGVAANHINNWVSRVTKGRIPNLVDQRSLDPSTQLLLTNAVFFKGIWNTTFSKERTVPRVFSVQSGRDKDVLFMHQMGKFRAGVADNLDAKWLLLPFLNLDYNMLFLLPNEDFGLDQMVDSLTSSDLDNILRDHTIREVVMGIPKFKLSLETDLAGPLKQEIPSIFSPSADLTGLGSSSNHELLYVSKVLHKVTMEINEEGSTAAAVTGLAVNTLSLASYNDEFRFTANHPFLVILFDKELSVPLFMAKIVDP